MHHRLAISLVLTVAALGTYAGTSVARSTPAALGRPANPSNLSCVNVDFNDAVVRNVCAHSIDWELGLPTDGTAFFGRNGNFTVNVPNVAATSCRVIGIGKNATGSVSSGFKQASTANAFVDLAWSIPIAPVNGLMFVDCIMGPQAQFTKNDHSPN
jgi:hypothetical protein